MRALVGVVEIYALSGGPAFFCCLVSSRGKRLGDYAAGTYVVRDRVRLGPAAAAADAARARAGGPQAPTSRTPPVGLALAVRQYLGRLPTLDPASRDRLGALLADRMAAYVAPATAAGHARPWDFLAAVSAARRERDLARLHRDETLRARLVERRRLTMRRREPLDCGAMIDRARLAALRADEERRFVDTHPRSGELSERAGDSLLAGVPMPWMTRWAGSFPLFLERASGARLVDVDGVEYVDLCLGDTGAMTGHGLPAVAEAVARRASAGITTMLPSDDALWVSQELARRFGLPQWQFAMTATDANRFVLRFARHLTGRPRIAVMDWCYHGTVDETFATLDGDRVVPRPGLLGAPVDVAETTAVIPFNDADALDRRLAEGDVACLLMEPALTNIGIVLPDEGYLDAVREITRRHGVLLVIDETHTLCAGPGGATAAWGLDPDLLVVGKPIARRRPARRRTA